MGVVYEDLNLREGTRKLKWPLFLTLYKIALAFILVFPIHLPFAQLILLDFNLTSYLIVVGLLTPHKLTVKNKWELFQQVAVFLIFYH